MPRTLRLLLLCLPLCWSASTPAQTLTAAEERAAVNLTASASVAVDNDRMDVSFQVMAENKQATVAASEVNAKMAKALAQAKATSGLTAKTIGYSTEQVWENNKITSNAKPRGWRVTQQLVIEASDFGAAANLATKLQEDGLLLTGINFRVSAETRRKVEARLQHEALVEWQARAKAAAISMGYADFRPGRMAIAAGGHFPQPMMRAQAMAMDSASAPVAVSGGSSELTVTVSGDALLRAK